MYTKQVVSFIDILGFKNLIESKTCEEMLEIHDAFYKFNKEEGGDLSELTEFKMINFSDCIVRCRPPNNTVMDAPPICLEILDLLNIQWQLIYCYGVLIRGAITIGDVYVDRTDEKATVFGKALNEAYDLESKKAKYPRIIIDTNILKTLQEIDSYYKDIVNTHLKQDSDGYYFINYLNCDSEMYSAGRETYYIEFLEKHKKVCENLLKTGEQEKDEKKRKKLEEKGNWLKEYHNQHISQILLPPKLEYELETTTLELRNKLLID